MTMRLAIAALVISAVTTAATAQQPYAGQQMREVASLSEQEQKDLLDGRGMGLARPAELNGHPGPMHVLELADQLALTPEQRQRVEAAFQRMKAKAKALGDAYIRAEKAVDQAFKSGNADAAEVAARVAEANRLLGEVRLSHLLAHVEITPILTRAQRAHYAELRGYAGSAIGGSAHQHQHKH